jgi:leader peptidase (prepilin peptidase)/N-methyltransferase
VVELLTGLLFAFFYYNYSAHPAQLFIYLLLISALIAVTFIDLEHKIIPDSITYPGIVVGLLASLVVRHHPSVIFFHIPLIDSFIDSFLGVLAGGGTLWAIAVLSKGGMGGGDVKLGGMLGAFLGWQYALLMLFVAFFIGAVVGIMLMLLKLFTSGSLKAAWKKRKTFIPFGPYLALGTLIIILKGEAFIRWYFIVL